MTTIVEGMKRPNHVLVLGTDPIAAPLAIRQALSGIKLHGNASATVTDLVAALERAVPGSSWWSAITR